MSEFILIPAMSVAFVVTVSFMIAFRPLARTLGLVDKPGGRKLHEGEIPIIGGLAMFIGVVSGLILLPVSSTLSITFVVASFLLILIGVLDDRFALPASSRIAIQVTAVLIMVYGAGYRLTDIGDPFGIGVIGLGQFSLLMTVLVSLTVINAYNLIDGADGLAGSLSLVALLAVALVGGYAAISSAVALTLAAAVVAFLFFNFPVSWNRPVRSFMGDAGSTFLGFAILWVVLGSSQGADRLVSPVIGLWFASVPIYDCLTCFVKRALARKSPFAPGRDHFHHVLNRGTPQVRRTIVVLTALQVLYAAIGLAGHYAGVPDFVMFAGWSVLGLTQFLIIRRIAALKRWVRMHGMRSRRSPVTAS